MDKMARNSGKGRVAKFPAILPCPKRGARPVAPDFSGFYERSRLHAGKLVFKTPMRGRWPVPHRKIFVQRRMPSLSIRLW